MHKHDNFYLIPDDPSITVHGNLLHGVFEGFIHTPDEEYHIEPSNRYMIHDTADSPSSTDLWPGVQDHTPPLTCGPGYRTTPLQGFIYEILLGVKIGCGN